MNPILVLLAIGGGVLLLSSKKATPKTTVASIPTPAGPIIVTTPSPQATSTQAPSDPQGVPPVTVPPIKVTLPTADDYPSKPASGNLDPMLDQSEQYALANYSNDQLYNEGMASGHLAYVAAIGTKLAASGDTRAADLTLRVANWGA
jgi:hypothetical protein